MTHDDTNRPDLHLAGDDALDHGLSDAQIDDMLRASGPPVQHAPRQNTGTPLTR